MKHAIILLIIACFYGVYAEDQLRLISFNESYTVWMSTKEIEVLIDECGDKGGHTGFIDITDYYPNYAVKPQREVWIPGGPTHESVVKPAIALLSITNIWSTITSLSAYTTRYYTSQTGVDAVAWLTQRYRTLGGSRLSTDITVTAWQHSWLQPSIVARIEGTTRPNEIVVIGGHVDSTSSGSRAPGADDDASGSATILEIFRVLASSGFKPERSIEFHGYAAEEVGLRGSQAIANNYYTQGKNVVGMFQLDMTAYQASNRVMGIVTDYTTPVLTSFLRALIPAYSTIGYTLTQCGYGCSDHASWWNAGYPASFAFESTFALSNPDIHTVRDTIDKLTQTHAIEFAKVGLGFVMELSYAEN